MLRGSCASAKLAEGHDRIGAASAGGLYHRVVPAKTAWKPRAARRSAGGRKSRAQAARSARWARHHAANPAIACRVILREIEHNVHQTQAPLLPLRLVELRQCPAVVGIDPHQPAIDAHALARLHLRAEGSHRAVGRDHAHVRASIE